MGEQQLLGVIGATGKQGGSVINFVLNDSELSKKFKVRAITRDPKAPAARSLADRGVEVVKGDVEEPDILQKALEGVDVLFAMTTMAIAARTEFDVGKDVADAAVEAGVKYLIFSTLPNAHKISSGKYSVPHFDNKAKTEGYIRSLPIKSSFFCPGLFMQNFLTLLTPQPQNDGTYVLETTMQQDTKIPLIDVVKDAGNYVAAILANPDQYVGEVVFGASEYLNMEEIAQQMSQVTGKTIKYRKADPLGFLNFLPDDTRNDLLAMFAYYDDFGFYGDLTQQAFTETTKSPRNHVASLKEFLNSNLLPL
ncbi:hypothetical protein TRICI_000976 [Trichomonascus ciferrii]|uniref:NmrA-like domain-containing protein n=1 Tax=Trichomonascus ciferrii TaxID=44093 RepID=A0A642VB68_9ASCO|nr:hypothetical protein TRICI_000976 [Trichomonascus ciferrii]